MSRSPFLVKPGVLHLVGEVYMAKVPASARTFVSFAVIRCVSRADATPDRIGRYGELCQFSTTMKTLQTSGKRDDLIPLRT